LQGVASGQIPGLAPIPVPGFAGRYIILIFDRIIVFLTYECSGPQEIPTVPGVNTIPGLSNFNYVVK
jgi:hypothetical protein